jgi:hypothetical protein
VVALEKLAQGVELAVADGKHQGVIGTWLAEGRHRCRGVGRVISAE